MTFYIRPYRHNPLKWEVDIKLRMPDGSTYRERRVSPVASRSGSKQWAQARERTLLLQGTTPQPSKKRAPSKTLAKFWPDFISGHSRANNQKPSGIESKEYHFRQYLDPVLGALPLDEITNAKVAELKRFMTTQMGADPTHKSIKGKKSSTINNCLSTLSKCLTCAVDWEVIPAMPCRIERLKKSTLAPRFYDFDAYACLVSAAASLDPRTELVALLGGDAGLRRGEILALEQARCDIKGGKLRIELNQVGNHVHETKGMEFRSVPMTARLAAAIKAHRHLRGPRLLYGDDGVPVTASMLRKWLAAAQKAAGLPKATGELHILRHTFCSHLAMRGAPVGSIQKLAGHKHLATTIRYMHLAEGETDRAIRLLEQRPGEIREKDLADTKNRV